MNGKPEKIANSQWVFLVLGFIHGSILLVSFTTDITKQDTWLAVLAALAAVSPFILAAFALAKRFSGMNLVQIHDLIYGPYLGKLISILYISSFLLILSFNIGDLGVFYQNFILPQTPLMVFLVTFTFTCAYAVRKGIEVLARICPPIVFITSLLILGTMALLSKEMNFANFKPVLGTSLKDMIHGTHIISAIPFGEIMIFQMIAASLKDSRQITKNTMLGLTLAAISLLLITIQNTAVLGSTIVFQTSPSFQVARLINIGLLTRMEILVSLGFTIALFTKCSILYYGVVTAVAQLCRLRTYLPLVIPLGCITMILAAIMFKSTAEHAYWGHNSGAIFVSPLIFIFPPLSLMIAKIRKLPK